MISRFFIIRPAHDDTGDTVSIRPHLVPAVAPRRLID
jgi:hypothetical protein